MWKRGSVKDIAEHLDKYSTVYGEVLLGIHNDVEHQEQRLTRFEKCFDTKEQNIDEMREEIAGMRTDIQNMKALVENSGRLLPRRSGFISEKEALLEWDNSSSSRTESDRLQPYLTKRFVYRCTHDLRRKRM